MLRKREKILEQYFFLNNKFRLTCPHKIARVDWVEQHIRNLLTDRLRLYIQNAVHHRRAVDIVRVGGAHPAALPARNHLGHHIVGGCVTGVFCRELANAINAQKEQKRRKKKKKKK